jgi:penicillin-binding protein 1A
MSARKPAKKKAASGGSSPSGVRALFGKGIGKRLLVLAFFCFAAGVLGFAGLLAYYGRDLPKVDKLHDYQPPQTTRIVDRKGRLIAETFEERRSVVPLDRMPRVLVLSVLAAEDADFYVHRGLDYAGILRALVRDVTRGKAVQGASTITQQIVKNLLLTPERTLARKVKELILARTIEQELSKDQILFLYLNHINFGHGRYGVQEASRFYFGKDVSELNLAEASLIAGLPQSPARLSPFTHPEAARRRQLYVLDQLAKKRAAYWDDLPLEDIEKARNAEPKLVDHTEKKGSEAPEIASYAREFLVSLVGEEAAKRGGYRIETTIDLSLQQQARAAVKKGLAALDQRRSLAGPLDVPDKPRKLERVAALQSGRTYDANVVRINDATGEIVLTAGGHQVIAELGDIARFNPKGLAASKFAPKGATARVSIQSAGAAKQPATGRLELGPQGVMVVIDPRSREVLALVSGDTAEYGFNRALHAVRQPGSTWKPITYALALDKGTHTAATLVLDAPEVFDEWRPSNYETWSYAGSVRLREALAQSINLIAVRVMTEVTPAAVVELARKLGITTELEPSLALALGASGVRPVELVNAYATFAAGGRFAPHRLIRAVYDAKGHKVKLPKPPAAEQVLRPQAAYVLTSMLESVVKSGTATAAKKLERPVAGKTGTSNNARDAWFVGYTAELVAGVWVGYDDHRPLGKGESGSKSALPIWVDFMQSASAGRPAVDFPVPSGIEHVAIDPKSGLRAYEGMPDAIDEVFIAGTAPTEIARPKDVLDSTNFMMDQLGGGDPTPPPAPAPAPQ